MNPARRLRLSRPTTARAVARSAGSLEEYGRNLRDWFHEIRRFTSGKQLADAVQVRPPRLGARIEQGEIADAFLAAQVEYLCRRAGLRPPRWTRDQCYILAEPWFSLPGRSERTQLLLLTPTEFRNRNVFTTSEIEFVPRRGRPRVSEAGKREKARLRQRRYREKCAQVEATVGKPIKRRKGSPAAGSR